MSDITPFEARSGIEAQVTSSDSDVFKPELAGVNWGEYEEREEILAGAASDPELMRNTIIELQKRNPVIGVMLDNMHNREISGEPINRLPARLAVMSRSIIKLDLPGLDLGGGVAAEAHFDAINIRGANFTDSVLPRAKFTGSDLSGASFVNAVVNGADFEGARLTGADFTGAYMVNVSGLTPEQLKDVNMDGARVVVLPESQSDKKDLASALSSHFGELVPSERIARTDPVPIALEGTVVPQLQTNKTFKGLYGVKLVLTDVDFTRSRLQGMTLEDTIARGIVLRGVKATGSLVLRSQFDGADLHSFWAPGSIWDDVSMRGANLTNANLAGSVLRGVDLSGVIGLNAKDTNLEGVILEDCLLPDGYKYDGFKVVGPSEVAQELQSPQ